MNPTASDSFDCFVFFLTAYCRLPTAYCFPHLSILFKCTRSGEVSEMSRRSKTA